MGILNTLFKGSTCGCTKRTRKHAKRTRKNKNKTYRGGYLNPENSSASRSGIASHGRSRAASRGHGRSRQRSRSKKSASIAQ